MSKRAEGHISHNTRWLLRNFLDQPWTEHALCIHYPRLPWTSDKQPNKEDDEAMATVCSGCPALVPCALFALSANYGHGVDGGFYGGVYMPWRSYYRARTPNQHERSHAKKILRARVNEAKVTT